MVPGAFIQCCELSATRVSELPVPSATPSSREQLPRADHSDEARLWGSAQEWHTHCLPAGVTERKNILSAERRKMYPFAGLG